MTSGKQLKQQSIFGEDPLAWNERLIDVRKSEMFAIYQNFESVFDDIVQGHGQLLTQAITHFINFTMAAK